ncbi:MAG: hypothetical protein Q4A47_04980 [Erysipelotrichaceae bacterium]|nr:hypothetical protein [Erysipelotrichaceae bacterium]
MPKLMLKQEKIQKEKQETLNISDSQLNVKKTNAFEVKMNEKLLRKQRSKKYIEKLHKLDVGGHVNNQEKVQEIINEIKQEFPEIKIEDILIGIVSICCLGDPYEVHTLDLSLEIIEHYKRGEKLPERMEKARSLAIHGGYSFIEVYEDCLRAVNRDGRVSVIYC